MKKKQLLVQHKVKLQSALIFMRIRLRNDATNKGQIVQNIHCNEQLLCSYLSNLCVRIALMKCFKNVIKIYVFTLEES